jgi:hypothetical protein
MSDSSELVTLAREIIDDLVRALPDQSFRIEESYPERVATDELAMTLRPANEQAASITIHVMEGVPVVDLVLGEGGFYEVRMDQGIEQREVKQRILRLAAAAIEGNYSETLWKKGDDVVRSRGTAIVGGNPVAVSWRQLFTNPFQRTRRSDRHYAPYTDAPPC